MQIVFQFHADGSITTMNEKNNLVNDIHYDSLYHLRSCTAFCDNYTPVNQSGRDNDADLYEEWLEECVDENGDLNHRGRRYERACDSELGWVDFSLLSSHVRHFLTEAYGYFEDFDFGTTSESDENAESDDSSTSESESEDSSESESESDLSEDSDISSESEANSESDATSESDSSDQEEKRPTKRRRLVKRYRKAAKALLGYLEHEDSESNIDSDEMKESEADEDASYSESD